MAYSIYGVRAALKNNGVGFLIGVWSFLKGIFVWTAKLIACVCWPVICLIALILSPLWFPIAAIKDSEAVALRIYGSSDSHVNAGVSHYLRFCGWAVFRACRWLYSLFIMHLPMKYRAEFMRYGTKQLHEYSVKNQVAYYKLLDPEGRQNLIASNSLSSDAFKKIWKEKAERANWVKVSVELSQEQVEDMLNDGSSDLLWQYFKGHTPGKEMLALLMKEVNQNKATAQDVMLKFIEQQRPSPELLGQLLNNGRSEFVRRVSEIIDLRADMDAVEFCSNDLPKKLTFEEKQKILSEKWSNFCKDKKQISRAAQKKMGHAQYQIFAKTGHKLEYYAFRHLCLTVSDSDYLKELVTNEFDSIDDNILTALKSDYWKYSTYLAVKQERAASAGNTDNSRQTVVPRPEQVGHNGKLD